MLKLIETAAIDPDEASRREEARRRQLAALEPKKWKPGQSGNPKGRAPEVHADVRKLAKEFCPEAIERLKHWARSEDPRASIPACSLLLERGCGKPALADAAPFLPPGFENLTLPQRLAALKRRREELAALEQPVANASANPSRATGPASGNALVATA